MEYPNIPINMTRVKVRGQTLIGPTIFKASFSVDDWKWFLEELRKIQPGKDFVIQTKERSRDMELRICNRDSGIKTL